jgi:GNAT superfamily N-acetyltransferase
MTNERTKGKGNAGKPAEAGAALAEPEQQVRVRLLQKSDSFQEITALLHRAYARQMAMGLKPLAGRQDVETTRKRCSSAQCFVAVMDQDPMRSASARTREKIVGIILFHEVEDAKGPPWFARPEVDSFSQFAVDPDVQGKGIGRLLLETAERRAREAGAKELGLSMAEPDTQLMEFYTRRGYRFVEHWQWPYTNYRSAILSKTL